MAVTDSTDHIVNNTSECLIKFSISKYVRNELKGASFEDRLLKRTSLKHSSFSFDKVPRIIYDQNNHYKNIFFEFNRWPVYVPACEVASFPMEIYNYNEIESSLSSREVLNSKTHTQLESKEYQLIYPEIFFTMYILHFRRLRSYMYGDTQQNTLKMQHYNYFLSF